MFCKIALVALIGSAPLFAQTVPPSQTLDHTALNAKAAELLKKAAANPAGVGSEILLTRPDGNIQMAVRVHSGQGEWHHDDADVLIGVEGTAEVITGGEIIDGKESAPGEIRGTGVKGGTKHSFGPGDIIRIEPQVAHQLILAPGTTVRYMAVKVHVTK
jgi:hypothetical protein